MLTIEIKPLVVFPQCRQELYYICKQSLQITVNHEEAKRKLPPQSGNYSNKNNTDTHTETLLGVSLRGYWLAAVTQLGQLTPLPKNQQP